MVLDHTLQSLHCMMQSSRTPEGLCGLIGPQFFCCSRWWLSGRVCWAQPCLPHWWEFHSSWLRIVLLNRKAAINIMATFIDSVTNHTWSWTTGGILQGNWDKPWACYWGNIWCLIILSCRWWLVIWGISNAIGACVIIKWSNTNFRVTEHHPEIFVITPLKVFQDKEIAVLISTVRGELIHHHSSLKESVFQSMNHVKIEDLGNTFIPTKDIWQYQLVPVPNHLWMTMMSWNRGYTKYFGVIHQPRAIWIYMIGTNSAWRKSSPWGLMIIWSCLLLVYLVSSTLHDYTSIIDISFLIQFHQGLFQCTSHCSHHLLTPMTSLGLANLHLFLVFPTTFPTVSCHLRLTGAGYVHNGQCVVIQDTPFPLRTC